MPLDGSQYIHIFEYMNKKATARPGEHALAQPALAQRDGMLAKAAEAAAFLRSLAHEHRLAILCALIDGRRSVGDLAAGLGLAQPKVSQHLAILRAQGLVSATRQGTSQLYAVADDTARDIVASLQAAFCPPAEGSGRKRTPERKS